MPVATSRKHRQIAMTIYTALLVLWIFVIGVPADAVGVAAWAWFGSYCWNVDAPRRSHLRFLYDWVPVCLLLIVYGLLRGLAAHTGVGVHYDYPIRFDRWVGRGEVPTLRLQHAWCGNPCYSDSPIRWYDTALTVVYTSHFCASLTIAGVLWIRNRAEFVRWIRRVLVLWYAGLVVYFIVPTAPPWLASQKGLLAPLAEISGRGLSPYGIHRTAFVGTLANKTAAFPSLHTGFSALIAFYAIQRFRSPFRFLMLLYPVAMGLTLVYGGDHYVADALGGAVTALLVLVGCQLWERRSASAQSQQADHPAGGVSALGLGEVERPGDVEVGPEPGESRLGRDG